MQHLVGSGMPDLYIGLTYLKVKREKNMEKQKEYNLRYLLAKVRTT
jgi:hypothetical protein